MKNVTNEQRELERARNQALARWSRANAAADPFPCDRDKYLDSDLEEARKEEALAAVEVREAEAALLAYLEKKEGN